MICYCRVGASMFSLGPRRFPEAAKGLGVNDP